MSDERTIKPNALADFTPQLGNYKTLQPFRYWCQKVLPLVYDDSLSYYELLCKVVDYLNKTMEDVETLHGDVTTLHTAYDKLQSYVNNYFSTLDVQEEINKKLDNMSSSGELYEIIRRYTDPIVNEQNDKIAVLKARMDTFASLPDGSTSGNAELIDIRVGYNGTTYPSAGDAVRGQVSELKNYLDYIIEVTNNLFNKSTIKTGLINSTGEIEDNSEFWYSDFIEVNNETFTVSWESRPSDDLLRIIFYNDSKVFQTRTIENVTNLNKITVTNTFKYVRLCASNGCENGLQLEIGDVATPYINHYTAKDIVARNDIKKNMTQDNNSYFSFDKTNDSVIDMSTIINGYYVSYTSGRLDVNADFKVTDFTPILPNKEYMYSVRKNNLEVYAIEQCAFYDENKNYVSGLSNDNKTKSISFTAPNNAYYVRWTMRKNTTEARLSLKDGIKEVLVGKHGDYTSLLTALKETDDIVTIRMMSGNFDVGKEYTEYYGSDFWENYRGYSSSSDPFMRGLWLAKGRKVIGSSNTKLLFSINIENNYIRDEFCFFANDTDVELSNLSMYNTGKIRYFIHDDYVPTDGIVIFKNLLFNGTGSHNAVIGAGLGVNNTYIIENCIFENNEDRYDIRYHGSNTQKVDNKCKIIVTNCYGEHMCEFAWRGNSTEITDCVVSNNKFGSIRCVADYDDSNIENMRLISWNNITN